MLKPVGERFALDLEALTSEIHELMDTSIERILISLGRISDTREVECDDPDRARHLCRTEESIAALGELSEIELESATHRSDSTRLVGGFIWDF